MVNNNKYLPIGTVVQLKGARRKTMINSYLVRDNNIKEDIFDYGGVLFPEGVSDSNRIFMFDHTQISKIIFMGLEDDEEKKFVEKLDDIRLKFENEAN